MSKRNLAFYLNKNSRPLTKIDNLKLPEPSPYHVLVKIEYSGICGSQIKEIDGKRGKDKYLPHLLGHEGYGKIIRIGNKIKKFKKNEYVLLSWIKGTGKEEKNLRIYHKNRFINSGQISTFSDFSLISENRCFKINSKLKRKFIPVLGCALPTGFGLIYKELKPKINKIYILSGMGGIGIFSYLALKLFKPKKIIILENNVKKIKILKRLDKKMNIIKFKNDEKKMLKDILKITDGSFADYVIDTTGNINAMNKCIGYLKNNGKFIFASHPGHKDRLNIDPHELIKGKKIQGSWGGSINQEKDKALLLKFYNKHFLRSRLKRLIKVYPLKKINKAIIDIKNGDVFKVILKH
jgi:S-(hydroxymethyl)glutathione dehydrogenase / alcohol dehydrogenase